MRKKILITGANYRNKGAQSMLFISVDEIRKRIPDCEIYFGGTWREPKLQNVYFKQICYARELRRIIVDGKGKWKDWLNAIIKALFVTPQKGYTNIGNAFDIISHISQMDLIIDVSGYALGDKWSKEVNEGFLDTIRIAMKYNIPLYLMPQSFGPFDYPEELQYLRTEIQELMRYPAKVFAREKEGYYYLVDEFGLKNVSLSCDLVLQNKGIDLDNVFSVKPELRCPKISTDKNVGIVPNEKCFAKENEDQILDIYRYIIGALLEQKKEIYLFRHSKEDMEVLNKIAELYGDEHIHLLKEDFSCLEYDEFVKNFDFIICSRFHGIVHAYRNNVPVIALGWAVKYRELAKLVGQEKYVFDIRNEQCDKTEIIQTIKSLDENLAMEKKEILKNMGRIQRENCFEQVEELVLK